MNDVSAIASQLSELIAKNQSFILVFPDEVHDEVKASALAMAQVLQSLGKKVNLGSTLPLEGQLTDLPLADLVQTKIGNKNLHIILDYTPEQVGRVFYDLNEDKQKFVMVVEPQQGQSPLDAAQVKFDYAGAEADVILVFGVQMFEQLDYLYTGYEDLYKTASTISLNHFQSSVANLNYHSGGMSGVVELVAGVVQHLGLEQIDSDLATTLLFGLESATDQFRSPRTTAQTFSMVSWLLQLGARRVYKNPTLNPLSSGMSTTQTNISAPASISRPLVQSPEYSFQEEGQVSATLNRPKPTDPVAAVDNQDGLFSKKINPFASTQLSPMTSAQDSKTDAQELSTQPSSRQTAQAVVLSADTESEENDAEFQNNLASKPDPSFTSPVVPSASSNMIQDFAINQLRHSDHQTSATEEVVTSADDTPPSRSLKPDFPNVSTGFSHVSESMSKLQEAIKRQEELNKQAEKDSTKKKPPAGGLDYSPNGLKGA